MDVLRTESPIALARSAKAAGLTFWSARRSSESACASRRSRCVPEISTGMRMCRPFALSPVRLLTWMMWYPNWESTGCERALGGREKAAASKAASMSPFFHSPRSPPFAALTLSDDSRLATSAKGAPPAISARTCWARASAAAESEASGKLGRET
jgi:hypothetical protein